MNNKTKKKPVWSVPDDNAPLSELWKEYEYRHSHIWKTLIQATAVIVALGALPYLPDSNVPPTIEWMPAGASAALALVTLLRMRREFRLFDSVKQAYLSATGRWDEGERGMFRHKILGFTGQVTLFQFGLLLAASVNVYAVSTAPPSQSFQETSTSPHYLGLYIEGESPHREKLEQHVTKCRSDSVTFKKLLLELDRRTSGTDKRLRFVAVPDTEAMIGHAGNLGEMFVDMGDLAQLADPIANGAVVSIAPLRYGFDPIPGRPPWASTICSWLGHEIAELLEDVVDGARDRPVHHYKIANGIGDQIVRDYYNVLRNRIEDCFTTHNGHKDILIQMGAFGVERYHMSPKNTRFGKLGDPPTSVDPGRLAYIEYQSGASFPGRKPDSNACDM